MKVHLFRKKTLLVSHFTFKYFIFKLIPRYEKAKLMEFDSYLLNQPKNSFLILFY